MKNLSEKLELCKVCKKRQFDPSCGIVCGLTSSKPTFEDECSDYVSDEVLVKQQELLSEATKEEQSLDGRMPGSNWFLWIAGLSIINIGLYFVNWRFFFGLGTTQLIQELMLLNIISLPLSIACMLMLPAFFLWTWWATAKRGIKLFYKIGWTVYLIDTIIYLTLFTLSLLSNNNTNIAETSYLTFILIVDIALRIAVLFAGFKLSKLKQIEGNTASTTHIVSYTAYIVLTIFVLISSPFVSATDTEISNPTTDIQYLINSARTELPAKIDEYTTLETIDKVGNEIRFGYSLTNMSFEDIDPSYIDTYRADSKQYILNNIKESSDFEVMCWEQGYTIKYIYNINSITLFDITITPEEYYAAK